MPVPVPPRKASCPGCGWMRVLPGGSDVMMPGDEVPTGCPRCGHDQIQVREMTWLEQMASPSLLLAEMRRRRSGQ